MKSTIGGGLRRFGYRKNIDTLLADAGSKNGLARHLTGLNLVTLGVAGIIGGGIFVLVGSGILKAGAMVVPAFLIAALICAVAGFAYAELAAAVPASGSAYAYIYTVMGELPGWMVAWALVLEYAVGAVSVAVACRNNLLAVINQFWHLVGGDRCVDFFANPAQKAWYSFTHSPLESGNPVDVCTGQPLLDTAGNAIELTGIINLPSILIVLAVTALLVRGTKESARVTGILVAIKVMILLFAIVVAFTLFNSSNLVDPLPHYQDGYNDDGTPSFYDARNLWPAVKAVFAAAAIMFFAYIGFDSVSTTAEETKNPKKDLPIGILGSLGISTLLYILAAGALVGSAHWSVFVGDTTAAQNARGEPFGYVFEANHALDVMVNGEPFSLGALLVRLGALIGTTSVLLVLILGGVRVFFNMSRDGLLPGWMSNVSKRGNPSATTWFYGILTLALAGFLTLGAAVELVNIGTLFAFLMVMIAAWVFRARRPDIERPFRMPLWSVWNRGTTPVLPMFILIGVLGCIGLMLSLDVFTLMASVAWAGLGLLVYALYGVRHSKEAAQRHASTAALSDPFLEGRPAGTTTVHEGYSHGPYKLFARNTATGSKSYFFAKGQPSAGKPAHMPKGYEVGVNERSGLPFLRRKA